MFGLTTNEAVTAVKARKVDAFFGEPTFCWYGGSLRANDSRLF
jgi:hypothetical protein